MQSLQETNIANIWTRIFHENQALKYEISILLKNGTSQVFQVFTNYDKYREVLSELVKIKDNDERIDLTVKTKQAQINI